MLSLTQSELAQVKHLTEAVYPYLHPDVRTYLNQQLLEAQYKWEVQDWLERLQLTLSYYEGGPEWLPAKSVKRTLTGDRTTTESGSPSTLTEPGTLIPRETIVDLANRVRTQRLQDAKLL